MSSASEFLYLELPGPGLGDERLGAAAAGIAAAGGEVLACEAAESVELLEPGTPGAAVVIARWSSRSHFDAAWAGGIESLVAGLVEGRPGALALAAQGLPAEGLPGDLDVPTAASVAVPELGTPPAYMAVQGSVTDPVRIVGYRDVILPMMKELLSIYVVFCIGGVGVRVLHGSWDEQIYAISRWPALASAHAFWWSERYQTVAVPIRTGIGTFRVHLLPGRTG